MWGRHMVKSWNSHQVNRFHQHHNKRLRTTCHAFVFVILHSFYPHHDKLSLSPHTVSHVAAGIGVNCRGSSCSLFQTGSVGEERALASLQRSPPHILSHSLSLHKTTFSTVAYQTSKMSKVLLMSFYFLSVCFFCMSKCSILNWSNSHLCMHKLSFISN